MSKVYQYKLVLLGESAVGKSSIVLRFVRNSFNEHQESTIGAAFLTQTLEVDGDSMKFEIWDTAGQERYHSLAPMYYRGAHAALVDSYERAKNWIKELQRQASPNIVISLVGNKSDLEDDRKVDKEVPTIYSILKEAESFAGQSGLLFTETSALTGSNIQEIFELIAKKLPKTEQHLASSRSMSGMRRVELKYDGADSQGQRTSSKCC